MKTPSGQRVRTAVLPVAGLGTRFLPVTKAVPKEMLPLVDRPCIDYIVAEAVEAGIERIGLVSSRGKESMADYFDRSPNLERHLDSRGKTSLLKEVERVSRLAEIVVVRQMEALGLGHAVQQARSAVGDEPFAVLLGDDIIDANTPVIGQLIEAQSKPGEAVIGLLQVPRSQTASYGICGGNWETPTQMKVEEMVEKPHPDEAPSTHAIVGRYVLPPEIFTILETTPRGAGGEIQLTDAISVLAQRGDVRGILFEGDRFDTGNPAGLLRASIHFARKRPDLKAEIDAIIAEFAQR